MTTQQLAFDFLGAAFETQRCRGSDPETSHAAAEEVAGRVNRLGKFFLESLRRLGNGTAREIASDAARTHPHLMEDSIRKRAKELVSLGLVRCVGVRRCGVSGKMATVYEEV